MKNWKLSALLNTPPGTASRINTVSRVYLIIALFVTLIFGLVWLFQFQMEASVAMRAYAGGEGLWAKAQKDALRSLEHYAISRDEADYQAYRRLVQVPLGDQQARIELQKPNPDLDIARKGYLQGRNHPVDIEYAIPFFLRFQHNGHMSQVIGHWTAADRLIAEVNGVAGALHDEIASGHNNPVAIRSYLTRLNDINRQVTVEEDLFSFTLAEASRWANDVSRNLTYAIALLFVALGILLSWPIIIRIRTTENELIESEALFRQLNAAAQDAIVIINELGMIIDWNLAAQEMFQYSQAEAVGQPMHQLIAPHHYHAGIARGLARFEKTGEGPVIGKNIGISALRKDGSEFPIELSISAVNMKGRWHAMGIIRDITERKQAEEALRVGALKHQLLFESSRDALMLLAPPSWMFTGANQATLQLFGASSMADFTALGPWNVSPSLQPDGRLSSEKAQEMIAIAMREGSHFFEWEHQRLGGQTFAADVLLTRMEVGKDVFLQATVRDITERKRTEEALRKSKDLLHFIVENVPARIFWKDRASRYLGCNTQFAKDAGLSRPDELTGKTDFEMGWKDQAELYRADDKATIESGNPKLNYEEPQTTPDGNTIWLRTSKVPLRDESNQVIGILGIYQDITGQKQAEEELRLRAQLLDSASDTIFMVDFKGDFVYLNEAAWKTRGYTRDEMMGINLHVLDTPKYEKFIDSRMSDLMEKGRDIFESEHQRKDGSIMPVEVSARLIESGGRKLILSVIRDITERKRTKTVLREAEKKFSVIFETAFDGIALANAETMRFTNVNAAFCRMLGYSSEELTLLGVSDIHPKQDLPHVIEQFEKQSRGEIQIAENLPVKRKDGSVFYADITSSPVNLGGKAHLVGFFHDITERKQVEAKLKLFRTLLDNSSDAIEVLDPVTLRLLDINETGCRVLNYSREELLSMSVFDIDLAVSADGGKMIKAQLQQSGLARFETVHRRKDGSTFPVEVSTTFIELDKPYLLSIARDITERKRVEQSLLESEARYRRITEGITDYQYTVRIENGRAVETTQGPACVKVTGYAAEEFSANPDLWIQMVVPEDRERVMQHVNQILAGNDGPPMEHRITRKNGDTRWISDTTILFRDASGKLLSYDGVIKDITEHKLAEKKSLEADIRLKEALTDVIGAIAATLEQRDPYTAGHQRRVAELAAAIGEEMGLAREVLEGIHFGGLIHDIGKISIPVEVLGKPGRLTDTELGLIKTHVEAGWQIVKEIAFPWPVADMVHQHHERLDGSGYPQGLKGELIVLEARILAVADVVEAMVANRPYRPGLGMDVALDEITQGRGTRFDPVAADACLRLIKEKGFVFTR